MRKARKNIGRLDRIEQQLATVQASLGALIDLVSARRSTGRPPKFYRDAEVRRFIVERAATMTIEEIRAECESRFGKQRTPSKSALGRFKVSLRDGALIRAVAPKRPSDRSTK